jgi:hypothetical protein
MGNEASCVCERNGERAEVKAVLEPPEIILRGAIRLRIPFAKMERLTAENGALSFLVGRDRFRMALGDETSAKWARKILAPPPSLRKKLGIKPGAKTRIIGTLDDAALLEACSGTEVVARGSADCILARVNTAAELHDALKKASRPVSGGAALWIIYRKGPGHAINESDVRSAGLAAAMVDVKVAAVSQQLTALKFVRRKLQ